VKEWGTTICLFVCNLQAEKKARIRQDKLEKGAAKAAEGLEKCMFFSIFSLYQGLAYWFSIESDRIISRHCPGSSSVLNT
jgi:hypothetical protein